MLLYLLYRDVITYLVTYYRNIVIILRRADHICSIEVILFSYICYVARDSCGGSLTWSKGARGDQVRVGCGIRVQVLTNRKGGVVPAVWSIGHPASPLKH